MTPSTSPQLSPATRARVKWDNILIVLIGVVAAAGAVAFIMGSGGHAAPKAPATRSPAAQTTSTPTDGADVPDADLMTAEEATDLVQESRDLQQAARFDEALDRLASVPAEFADSTGATLLASQVEAARTKYSALREQLDAAIEARQFEDAAALLDQMRAIAPRDLSLDDYATQVGEGLNATGAPEAGAKDDAESGDSPAGTGTKPAKHAANTANTQGGGGTGTAHPTTTPPQTNHTQQPQRPKAPANNPTGAGGGGATNVAGVGAAGLPGNVQLTQAQQQELEQALTAALG